MSKHGETKEAKEHLVVKMLKVINTDRMDFCSKSSEYLPGEEFVDSRYRNSWNAVFVAGGWRLVQANWGMLSVNNKMARETRQIYQGEADRDRIVK